MSSDSYHLPDHSGFQILHGSQYYQGQYGPLGTMFQPHFVPLHLNQVVEKYQQLKMPSGMSRLAVKLARESLVRKLWDYVPHREEMPKTSFLEPLLNLKLYLVRLFPTLSNSDFEGYWKTCLTSTGHKK